MPRATASPPPSVMEHPGVLGAAALAGIDDERSFGQRHPGQTPRNDGAARGPGQDEGPQVNMARSQALGGQRRTSGERKRRSEEHTSELQSQMRIQYAVFCLKNKTRQYNKANI